MFSVIMPVYNGAKFISNAADSVLAQTYGDWELIIINDGSTDGTAEVLKKYENNEKVHIITQKNMGVSAARNNGVAVSRGDYIAMLDADDLWHENHLAVMTELIKKYPSAGLYASFAKVELANGSVITECEYFKNKPSDILLEDFFDEYHRDKGAKMFVASTTCIKREAFYKAGGFPLNCAIGEDLELTLRVAAYYPVALSGVTTATYDRKNSAATKDISLDPNWGFFDTVKELYGDGTIPEKKRENIKRVMAWFTMRRCRHFIIDGDKKRAWTAFYETDRNSVSRKDLLISIALLMLPAAVVRRIFAARWRGKA